MLALIIFLVILGALIIVHEFGHFIAARKLGVGVENFSLGFGPVIFKKKEGPTEYSIGAIPLGGFVKMAGDDPQEYTGKPDEYFSKPVSARFLIIFCGPLLNYVMGILFFWLIFILGYPTLTTKVGGLVDGFGAKVAGLQSGDRITAIDGKKVIYWEDLQEKVQVKTSGNLVKLAILRNNQESLIEVKIETKDFIDPLGRKHSIGLLGITPDEEIVKIKHGILESIPLSFKKTWELTVLTYSGLWRIITGKLSMRDSVTGPLGIFFITAKAAHLGFIALLHLMAVLSISLAIFNLLPLPVLDGGHLLFLALEKIRGRRLSVKTEQIVTNVGLTLIIMLAVIATYNDIIKNFGDKISHFFR